MPDAKMNLYWDANVFLYYINDEPDRAPIIDALLSSSAAPAGSAKVYTSVISHVEVAYGASEQQNQTLDPSVGELIENLWTDPNVVTSVEYNARIGRIARDLIRESMLRSWSLRSIDAIHLATAVWLSQVGIPIGVFHTYEPRLVKFSELTNIPVREPYTQQPNLL